jgi:hypothetical protein
VESTSDEIRRLLIATEERGKILAERTALLAKQVLATAEANKLAQRDVAATEKLVSECQYIKRAVADLIKGLGTALERQATAEQLQLFSDRIALLVQITGQLVTAVALLGKDNEAGKELEQLRKDMIAILAEAVKRDGDVSVTAMGQIKGDLSGNVAGRNIEQKE